MQVYIWPKKSLQETIKTLSGLGFNPEEVEDERPKNNTGDSRRDFLKLNVPDYPQKTKNFPEKIKTIPDDAAKQAIILVSLPKELFDFHENGKFNFAGVVFTFEVVKVGVHEYQKLLAKGNRLSSVREMAIAIVEKKRRTSIS